MSEQVPFWKKEISLRKPKGEQAPKPPKAEKPKKVKAEKAPKPPKEPKQKRSFRKPKEATVATDVPVRLLDKETRERFERPKGTVVVPVVPEPSEAVQRLQRWSSRAYQPSEVEPAPAAEPAPVPLPTPTPVPAPAAAAPKEEKKPPLWKREIKLSRAPKAPKAAKPPKEPKAKKEKQPKTAGAGLKRELTLPKPKELVARLSQVKLSKPAAKKAAAHKITNVVGLRIGSTQLAAAHVQNNGSHELLQVARKPLERGLVVGGEVRDTEALTRAVKAFFAENKLPRKDVRLGVASNRIGVRVLDMPAIDDPKAFENALRFRAQELLPIPVTDAILDHVVLGESRNDEEEVVRRVLLVFAHRDLVNRFVDVCRDAGVRLSGIDLDAFALLRAVHGPKSEASDEKAVVAVAIGHERTVLAVSDGETCDYTRVLEWGGSALDVAIARALNLSPSQAEPVKQLLDLDSETAPEGLSPVQFEAVKAAAKTEIGVLGRELVSSLRFYQSRPDSLALGEVLLTGGGSQLRGLVGELNRLLGIPMHVVDPLQHVSVNKKVGTPSDTGSLAIAIGLGIEA